MKTLAKISVSDLALIVKGMVAMESDGMGLDDRHEISFEVIKSGSMIEFAFNWCYGVNKAVMMAEPWLGEDNVFEFDTYEFSVHEGSSMRKLCKEVRDVLSIIEEKGYSDDLQG